MASYDLVIKGGTIVDGSGEDEVVADVGITGRFVGAIGKDLGGHETIDAHGHVVVPGFIDIHTHFDAQVVWDPWLLPSSALGVTSAVGGNCGYSLVPCPPDLRPLMMRTLEATEDMSLATLEAGISWQFESYGDYRAFLSKRGVGINFGTYVGHTAVRLSVMGEQAYEREATDAEVVQMRAVVIQAIREGALGFSTNRNGSISGDSGRPIPSMVASERETRELCLAVSEAGRGIVSIAAGSDPDFAYDLASKLGRTITWNSILAFPDGDSTRMSWRDKLACHVERMAEAPDVHPQVTCRKLVFTFSLMNPISFYGHPSFADLPKGNAAERKRRFVDPEWRNAARQQFDAKPHAWSQTRIMRSSSKQLIGRDIGDVAAERRIHPLDALLDISLEDDLLTEFEAVAANTDPEAVGTLLNTPGCILGLSDAGAHVNQICDAVLPVDFLSTWVRDRGIMSRAAGVRKLTGELAGVMGLRNRGVIRPGAYADVAVLSWNDLEVGRIERVHDLPGGGERLAPTDVRGVRDVLVNGHIIRASGDVVSDEHLSGMLLDPKA